MRRRIESKRSRIVAQSKALLKVAALLCHACRAQAKERAARKGKR